MYAVVFEVEMKEGWEAKADEEIDYIVKSLRELPGFIRGTWTTDGRAGLGLILFESKDVAQQVVVDAYLPPDASAVLRSARVDAVIREA